ncbi:sensor histidine kinase [Nocardiopsis sediminis]|uniref:histidine kinase n=1 Tax=Nocardiopsis sediminis TaxID=1778267 RepID=A0ABV8FTH9_9ACTN
MTSRLRLRPTRGDTVATAVAAVLAVGSSVLAEFGVGDHTGRPLMPWGLLLIAVAVLPLLWRDRLPVAVALVSTTATTAYYPMAFPDGALGAVGAYTLFRAAVDGHRWQAWLLGCAQSLVIGGWESLAYGLLRPGAALAMLAWMLVVLISAEAVRRRNEYLAAERERAEEAARTREEAIRRRAADERVRLAREVHDTVAHNISQINVQAGSALYLIDAEPERAAEALAIIKRTSRETLRELRATLNVLRTVDEKAPRSPAPGLDGIGELTEGARSAGIEVRVAATGGRRRLSAGVEAAAYRIVQESLTNAVRHSGAATVTVDLAFTAAGLTVEVRDDGTASAGGFAPGNGIAGMRERAAALGGTLDAAPHPAGGFAVRATLPDNGATAAPPEPVGSLEDGTT